MNVEEIKPEDLTVPTYRGKQVIACYISWTDFRSTTAFEMLQLSGSAPVSAVVCGQGTILPFARNNVTRGIYKNFPNFTHIMYIDADMAAVTPALVKRLIDHDVDVVAPIMTTRKPPFKPCIQDYDIPKLIEQLEKEPEDRKLIEVHTVGLGLMLVSRKVLDATAEILENKDTIWFTNERQIRSTFFKEITDEEEELQVEMESTDSLETAVKEAYKRGVKAGLGARVAGVDLGEDYSFCSRVTKQGFKIHCDTGAEIFHIGEVAYGLSDWLKTQGLDMDCRLEQGTKIWVRRPDGQDRG